MSKSPLIREAVKGMSSSPPLMLKHWQAGCWTQTEHGQFLGWLYGDVDGDGYCNLDGFPGPGFSVSLVDAFDEQLPWNVYSVEVFVCPDGALQPTRLDDAIDLSTKNQFGSVIWSKGQKLVIHGYHGLGFWE